MFPEKHTGGQKDAVGNKIQRFIEQNGQGNVPFTFNENSGLWSKRCYTHMDMILWLDVIQKFYAKPDKITE